MSEEISDYRRAHELMVKQFEIMRREKEHGWAEADRWESKYEELLAKHEEAGWVRVKLDDPALVELIARAIAESKGFQWVGQHPGSIAAVWEPAARAVIRALAGEDKP